MKKYIFPVIFISIAGASGAQRYIEESGLLITLLFSLPLSFYKTGIQQISNAALGVKTTFTNRTADQHQ